MYARLHQTGVWRFDLDFYEGLEWKEEVRVKKFINFRNGWDAWGRMDDTAG